MSDKNSTKFPYILLQNLSDDRGNVFTESSTGRNESSSIKSTPTSVKVPQVVSSSKSTRSDNAQQGYNSNLNGSSISPIASSTSTSTQPSKGLSRHLALSKQYAMALTNAQTPPSKPCPQITNEFQALRQELKARIELRQSKTPLYSSVSHEVETTARKSQNQDLMGDVSTKLDLEALSKLFPHRSKQLKSCRILQDGQSTLTSMSESALSRTAAKNPKSPIAIAAKSVLEKSGTNVSPSTRSIPPGTALLDQLKSRIDGLTVHVKSRDCEVTKLKEAVVELQLSVLNQKQEVHGSNELMETLSLDMESLSSKLDSFEEKLINQETNILNKLLLIEEMGSSDSESDYGKAECKPSNWMTSSSSSSGTTNPCKASTNVSNHTQQHNQTTSYNSGISSLKECVNWVPIAPDFDKLLNVIALLNFRMDRNQSMQLSRVGNEATFKHADTIPLVIFKNGLILGNSGFRSYATLSVIKLINEMFSGYFPSELHSQYPDGIVFVVSDKRSIIHELCPGFNGQGMKLSEAKSAPLLLPGAERLSIPLRKSELSVKSDLPKSHSDLSISSIASSNDLSPSSCCLLPDLNKLGRNAKGHKMICLKLKNTSSGHCYKLRLSTSTTIDAVLEHLEKYLNSNSNVGSGDSIKKTKFDIVLPLPYGILTSGNSSLKDYGLVTNTLLYIQPTNELASSDSAATST